MERDILLMCEDSPVMRINFSEGRYNVLSEILLPYGIKGRIRRVPDFTEVKTRYDDIQRNIAIDNNRTAVASWFAHRTLLLSRKNARMLYNMLGMSQVDSDAQRLKISFICRAVSVLDHYWVKVDGDGVTWDRVDITRNPLNEVVAQVALHGGSLTLTGSLVTPELTTDGAYAKAWRKVNGELCLYKKGHSGSWESKVEVKVSNLLDKMNVNHVKYYEGEDQGEYVCICPAMSSNDLSVLPAMEYRSYCNVNGLNMDREILRIDADGIYKMWIVDYLISNSDRHDRNWGFYYNPRTMEILSTHPLFDHNNAFEVTVMDNPDVKYICTGMSYKQSAMQAIRNVDFRITGDIGRSDFLTERQYNSFMKRAELLGLL